MLLTDNSYPRFYGALGDDGSQAMYAVIEPGAWPVYKFPKIDGDTCQFSASFRDEEQILEKVRRVNLDKDDWSCRMSKGQPVGRIVPPPDVAAKILQCYYNGPESVYYRKFVNVTD